MQWIDEWVAFDTETTGLGPDARIVEIGIVVFVQGEPVHEYSQLLCPDGVNWEDPNVQKAMEVNGISQEDLKGKPTFAEVYPRVLLELSLDVWVAHNASFDMQMLEQECSRIGKPKPEPAILVCTKNLSSHLRMARTGNRLSEVAARYKVAQASAHRAVVDARTCGLVLSSMVEQGSLPGHREDMKALCGRLAAKRW